MRVLAVSRPYQSCWFTGRCFRWAVCLLTVSLSLGGESKSAIGADSDGVLFDRDIRPLLSDTCFKCHGPDEKQRVSQFRLDTRSGAFATRDGESAIVPGKPEQSEIVRRITSDDPELKMPPPDSGLRLSSAQIELIQRWIRDGAKWEEHWAFVRPQRPAPPVVQNSEWPKNAIDRFVLSRLEAQGLSPAPPARREALIRRLSLSLTGLPPTIAEVDAFLADQSPQAYERVVDRLLASPRYGERMATPWLDAARYADTSGYQSDGNRTMWRWRDWVIEAYNTNKPFDEFTIEQLAGDMLPNPTLDQLIATGFNRNHRGNAEGGIIAEEYLVEYVVDRVETTATVWLGLTMGCARCHDHKYDPISQRDFYRTFAFFHNVPENGKAVKYGNSPPFIPAPTRPQQRELAEIDSQIAAATQRLASAQNEIAAAEAAWASTIPADSNLGRCFEDDLRGYSPAGPPQIRNAAPPVKKSQRDNSSEPNFADDAIKKKPKAKPTERPDLKFVPGPNANRAVELDGSTSIIAGDVGGFGFQDAFTLSAWIRPENANAGTILSRMEDVTEGRGYCLVVAEGRLHIRLVERWLDDAIRVQSSSAVPVGKWTHVAVSYNGSRYAEGLTLYLNGQPQSLEVNLDELNQTFRSDEPLRIGGGGGAALQFRGQIDEVRVYAREREPHEVRIVVVAEPIAQIASVADNQRTADQRAKLRAYFMTEAGPERFRRMQEELHELRKKRDEFTATFPTTMVMQEMKTPRSTFILSRGAYDQPTEEVSAGTPSVLPPLPTDAAADRLTLARWLVSPQNPLTARVTVNRYWQMLFGAGLVKTTEDFGSQGDRPSHPGLLDWLAVEYVENGWDTKSLLKTIVMSATYQQSSAASPALNALDPENRLLARGPRFRLSAQIIRDQALAVSGLLTEKQGGPSVKPYQPEGLWKEIATINTYDQGHGEDLYRRSLYTFWKRTVAPPTMSIFDSTGREMCSVRTSRTNTPLQALALMNDVTFVEAARKLAERMLREGGDTPEDRIRLAFRLTTSREPTAAERNVLSNGLAEQLAYYREHPDDAKSLLSAGESPRDESLDPAEVAACTMIASLILNLDETMTLQ